jgi:hypothetical protein
VSETYEAITRAQWARVVAAVTRRFGDLDIRGRRRSRPPDDQRAKRSWVAGDTLLINTSSTVRRVTDTVHDTGFQVTPCSRARDSKEHLFPKWREG